jgi:hypothetical protein
MQYEEARRRRLVRRLVASSALSSALFAAEAGALDQSAATFGGGLFVGYTFGPGRGLELGVEGYGTHRFDLKACSSAERHGVGGTIQLGLIDFQDVRVTLAGRAGREAVRGWAAYSGELGASYRFGEHSGFGIHTGILAETLFLYTAFRYQWLLNDATLGGGVRFPSTYGLPGSCAVGRPLRTESGIARLAPARSSADTPRTICRGERIPELGSAWARDAQQECASVPAFHQLAVELLEHGAPLSLVERALDAAEDEIRHAMLCASLASHHLDRIVLPTLPRARSRPPLRGLPGLVRLATESWLDGCLSEGFAAAHATGAAKLASNHRARAAQRRIGRDEARHAELSWSVLEFATRRGGKPVRDSVSALRDIEPFPASPLFAPEGFASHGRLGARALDAITDERAGKSRERLDRCFSARGTGRAPSAPSAGAHSSAS